MKNKGIKKLLCLLVLIALSLEIASPSAFAASERWDGYKSGDNAAASTSLFDFKSILAIEKAGAIPKSEYSSVKGGYSAYWAHHDTNSRFKVESFSKGVPSDWSNYTRVSLEMYSPKVTFATVKLVIYSRNDPETGGISYYHEDFHIDWEGWTKLSFPIDQMSQNREPDIKEIIKVELVANGGWSIVGDPESELYISSMALESGSSGEFMKSFYGSDKINEAYDAMEDSVAFFADATNAVTTKGAVPIKYDIDFQNGTVMVPTSVFAEFFGANTEFDGDKFSIGLNGIALWGSVGTDTVNIGEETKNARVASYTKDSLVYVDGEAVASMLGLSAFTDGRLLCMGTPEMVNELKRPGNRGVNEFNEIVAQTAYYNKVDVSKITAEDGKKAKDNYRRYLVGDETTNDTNDADIMSKIKTIEANAEAARTLLIKKNTPSDMLFEGLKLLNVEKMSFSYIKVRDMAKAYGCYGCKYYKDPALLDDIIYCLDWLGSNYFNAESRKNWVQVGLDNWHDWDVDTPEALVEILMLIEDALTPEEIDDYLKYFYTRLVTPNSTAANLAHEAQIIAGSALLRGDWQKVIDMGQVVLQTYLYVDDDSRIVENKLLKRDFPIFKRGSGYYTDGSYVFHTFHAMTGSYGVKQYLANTNFETIVNGTVFDINSSLKYNTPEFFFNNFDPVIYGTTLFRVLEGRTPSPNTYLGGLDVLSIAFAIADNYDTQTRDRLYSIVKDSYIDSPFKASFIAKLPLKDIKKFKEVMADESVVPRGKNDTAYMLANMDKYFAKRDNWAIGVSMSSSRIFNYESANGENINGWYLGDGRTEWVLKNDSINGTATYWNTINPYRLPGTTVDTQERRLVAIHQGNEYLSSKDFVGGLTLEGKYGLAAMDLESYHNDEDFGVDNGLHGGKAPAHKNDLVAKKSYFTLDDSVVCLGSGINAKDNNNAEVLTVVDNLMASSVVSYSDTNITSDPYSITGVKASVTPEAENGAENTIDANYSTKWAGNGGEIVWDLGESKTLGFISLSLLSGSKRTQKFSLEVSADGENWETVFDGESSGKKEYDEAFDLKGKTGRFVKYINNGNSAGSMWVSITECEIYPPNADGSIGVVVGDIYGNDKITADGKELKILGDDYVLEGTKWLNFDDKCGYYFPTSNTTDATVLKGRWTKGNSSFFEMWYSHGINPTDEGYAYVLLPGATEAETADYAANSGLTVLKNDSMIQAIKDAKSGITGIVFWQKGTIEGITVDAPCAVMVKETDTEYIISVSDPTQKLENIKLTLPAVYTLTEGDDCAEASVLNGKTLISYDMKDNDGRTFECRFVK